MQKCSRAFSLRKSPTLLQTLSLPVQRLSLSALGLKLYKTGLKDHKALWEMPSQPSPPSLVCGGDQVNLDWTGLQVWVNHSGKGRGVHPFKVYNPSPYYAAEHHTFAPFLPIRPREAKVQP